MISVLYTIVKSANGHLFNTISCTKSWPASVATSPAIPSHQIGRADSPDRES